MTGRRVPSRSAGQIDDHVGITAFFGLDFYVTAMGSYDVIAEAKPQARTLAGGFRGKERLENFVQYFFRNTVSIVTNGDGYLRSPSP